MGGNALKTVTTRRLAAPEYAELSARVLSALSVAFPEARPHVVRSYATKPDFGDMDVLVVRAGLPDDLGKALRELFGSREVVHNGPVYSFEVDAFQVDLICTTSGSYAAACDYFAFNDAGNLMGRVSRRMGFKYGHDGLRYVLREGDYVVADVLVSDDMPAVFAFLGYDHERFSRGFQTLEEMFEFVAGSPYFDPTAYALEQRNHVARTRDRKRASYRAFLEWIDLTQPQAGALSVQDREGHMVRAKAAFPGFASAMREAEDRHERQRQRRKLFSGDHVRELTGFEGPRLGALMSRLRNGYPGGQAAFDAWLDSKPELDELDTYVRNTAAELERQDA